jgi:RimJ/RimL family protein N-acetyltransferase
LHARIGPGALEIGYWIDQRLTRRGYATEATLAMTNLGFSFPQVDRLEIRCDPGNKVSARIPRRLGYRYVTTLENDAVTPGGEPRDTMVWELTRGEVERWNGGTVKAHHAQFGVPTTFLSTFPPFHPCTVKRMGS